MTEFDHNWAELDQNVARTEDSTRRLAVMNMDWDRIKSIDLLVLFNSFKPQDGVINSVTVGHVWFGGELLKRLGYIYKKSIFKRSIFIIVFQMLVYLNVCFFRWLSLLMSISLDIYLFKCWFI